MRSRPYAPLLIVNLRPFSFCASATLRENLGLLSSLSSNSLTASLFLRASTAKVFPRPLLHPPPPSAFVVESELGYFQIFPGNPVDHPVLFRDPA